MILTLPLSLSPSPSLKDAGLKLFKNIVFDEVKADVVKAMLVVIDTEREGGEVDRDLLRQCVEVFDAMGMGTLEVYVSDFEDHLLVSTREYYSRKSQFYLHTDDTPSYMIKAEAALDAERERVHAYVGESFLNYIQCTVWRDSHVYIHIH